MDAHSGVNNVSAEHRIIAHSIKNLAPHRWAICPAGTCVIT